LASTSSSSSTSRSTAITDQEVPGEAASTELGYSFGNEKLSLLRYFVNKVPVTSYPTLTVALLRLRQTCPMVSSPSPDASAALGGTAL
jgi:hypothetical protein